MRTTKTTKTMKSISLMYDGMHLNEEQVYHKAKLLLDIYRDVVWKTVQEVNFVRGMRIILQPELKCGIDIFE